MRKFVVAVALAASLPLVAHSQGTPPTAHPPSTDTFADKAAITNQFEIEAGQIAEKKSQNDDVVQYAKMIVQDHQKAQDQLQSILQDIGVTVPAGLDQAHLSMIALLKMLSGEQFLSTFKLQQVGGHKQAILLVQAYAESGDNAKLQDWAKKTLPVLKKHLAAARQLPPQTAAPDTTVAPPPGNAPQAQPSKQ